MNEFESTQKRGCFLCLTYEDSFLPPLRSLDKDHLQRWMKRLRKRLEFPIKYYMCGEYGGLTSRPHYHAIIFGVDPPEMKFLQEKFTLWHYGNIHYGHSVTMRSCSYVAKYIDKAYYGRKLDFSPRQAPFQLQSQGLGLTYVLSNADQLRRDLEVETPNGKAPLPRYYRQKLGIDSSSPAFQKTLRKSLDKTERLLYDQGVAEIYEPTSGLIDEHALLLKKQGLILGDKALTKEADDTYRRLRLNHMRSLVADKLNKPRKDDKL